MPVLVEMDTLLRLRRAADAAADPGAGGAAAPAGTEANTAGAGGGMTQEGVTTAPEGGGSKKPLEKLGDTIMHEIEKIPCMFDFPSNIYMYMSL